jgi:hypothetical protein
VGILVGFIVGLSASPVTSTVLGAISAGLLVLLGLTSARDDDSILRNSITVAAFGLSCAAALLVGVYLRTHNVLAVSLTEQNRQLQAIFPDQADRIRILLLENYGLSVQTDQDKRDYAKRKSDQATSQPEHGARIIAMTDERPGAGYLRNSIANNCDYSRRKQFTNVDEYVKFLRRNDSRFASMIEAQPTQYRDQFSQAISDYLCP